ncbi:hypothetical protein PFICI_09328 [Pestalotiopsis fici W106-1]|uniref:Uncharacterized protein n=1 Tax=Pestalotiopsis fici (strain W106-1 / CGMCC3.15140) TaxID=1229662 RepID=W3X046_PESFW|nr:uncharacterized protein PFICI_09328 [Pestalotiopsis fici W106-1]ETS79475.1 hypothetical protein PFICI_09328 [Pestalotiopsis fici W106-1]
MNGIAARGPNGYDARPQPPRPLGALNGPVVIDGYRQHDSRNAERMQSSAHVDLRDPVQMHLLTETALYDSREYEILSQEEVDDLKKEVRFLSEMIEQTRSKLIVQAKFRDAAVSMARLYTPASKRKSLLGNRTSVSSSASEVEAERDAILKRCDSLTSELHNLETRIIEPQRRLLEHTAGILQLTHKNPGKNRGAGTPRMRAPLVNGIPASPESMYTTSNGRNSMDADDIPSFDEDSWTRSFDDVLDFPGMNPKKNTIEIPLKSPVRVQHKQLTEESERLREENLSLQQEAEELRKQTASLSAELETVKREGTDQWRLISDTEQKLEMFNEQMREMILKADPVKNADYSSPPSGQMEPGNLLGSHLEYLQKALAAMNDSSGNNREALETLFDLNGQVQHLLTSNDVEYSSPPSAEAGFEEQVSYMYGAFSALDTTLRVANERSLAGAADRQRGEQNDAVLMGVWEIIQSGFADIEQQRQDRKQTRMDKGLEPEDDDMSDTEAFDLNEEYSLAAFSTKVQWLYAQATNLKEQKTVLKRQIKQQRELNNKSDSEKDEVLRLKDGELEQTRAALARVEKEASDVRQKLSDAVNKYETAQNHIAQSSTEQSSAISEAQSQLKERNAQLSNLQANTQELQMRLSAAEANITTITNQLRLANDAKYAVDLQLEEKEKEMKAQQEELDEMTGMVAEYKIEATLAKAELDGAYGSRRERAADAAALYNNAESAKLQLRVERLQPRIDELESELKGTVKDLKDITKQAIDAETKIADLETELDRVNQRARKDKEQLQESLDQERLKATAMPLSPSGRPNASILTDSYRDALRAERKKYEQQLREEQMNRRKIEEELRQLRKAMGPGKSPLSPGLR